MKMFILDEEGEVAEATFEVRGGHEVAIVDGRILIPAAFTVLSETAKAQALRAQRRALAPDVYRLGEVIGYDFDA